MKCLKSCLPKGSLLNVVSNHILHVILFHLYIYIYIYIYIYCLSKYGFYIDEI